MFWWWCSSVYSIVLHGISNRTGVGALRSRYVAHVADRMLWASNLTRGGYASRNNSPFRDHVQQVDRSAENVDDVDVMSKRVLVRGHLPPPPSTVRTRSQTISCDPTDGAQLMSAHEYLRWWTTWICILSYSG